MPAELDKPGSDHCSGSAVLKAYLCLARSRKCKMQVLSYWEHWQTSARKTASSARSSCCCERECPNSHSRNRNTPCKTKSILSFKLPVFHHWAIWHQTHSLTAMLSTSGGPKACTLLFALPGWWLSGFSALQPAEHKASFPAALFSLNTLCRTQKPDGSFLCKCEWVDDLGSFWCSLLCLPAWKAGC